MINESKRVFNTETTFWLLKLNYFKIYYAARQIFYETLHYAFTGTYGLRVLFGREMFYSEPAVNINTGEIGWAKYSPRTPVSVSIK